MNVAFNFKVDKRLLVISILQYDSTNVEQIEEFEKFKTFVRENYPKLFSKIQSMRSDLEAHKPLMNLTERDFILSPKNVADDDYVQEGLTIEDYRLIDKISEDESFNNIYQETMESYNCLRKAWGKRMNEINFLLSHILRIPRRDYLDICVIHPEIKKLVAVGNFNTGYNPYIIIGRKADNPTDDLCYILKLYLATLFNINNQNFPKDHNFIDAVIELIIYMGLSQVFNPETSKLRHPEENPDIAKYFEQLYPSFYNYSTESKNQNIFQWIAHAHKNLEILQQKQDQYISETDEKPRVLKRNIDPNRKI